MNMKEKLESLGRNSIQLKIARKETYKLGATRFGGKPDVPPDFVWPTYEGESYDHVVKDRPLTFLAQFNCAELAQFDKEHLLPDHGLLSFFYETDTQCWGYDPKDKGCARVYWFEDMSALSAADFPADIKNRKGQNWHDASVGGILHNPLYKGILRSGETYAGPFDELQIIAPDHFDLAQKLMLERTNERKEHRTVPLNTTGQSLLSGNIFCGHCGGRLVLTTNGKTVRRADGTAVYKKRIRYVCYNKTRRRQECTGQTGYTMHIVDGIVTEVLHQVFNKMQGASGDMIVGSAVQKQMAMIRSELQRARAENTKANKEYESLKAEVLKAIQGKSALPQDVLSEMLEDARQKVLSSSERITELTAELNDGNSKIEEMKAEFNQIVSWSKIFDDSPMEVKKMICGYIIKKVSVCKDYDIKIEFNINVEQFLNGIDGVSECDTSELSIAQ